MKIKNYFRLAVVLLLFTLGPFVSFISFASAASSQTGKYPSPTINQWSSNFGNGSTSKGISVIDGGDPAGFNSNFGAIKGNGNAGEIMPDGEGLYTNIQSDKGVGQMTFEMELSSTYNDNIDNAMYVNCSNTIIPISFCNASSFSDTTTNITYTGNLPTFNNTITFNNISIPTYGNGISSISVSFVQQFLANYTDMSVKMDVLLNLSNMSLFDPNTHQQIASGTPYSFNFMYMVDLSNYTESIQVGHTVNLPPTNITSTGIYFSDNNQTGYQYNIADMRFGDSYKEIQGNQSINKNTTAYFAPTTLEGIGSNFVNCYQSFTNLTYGKTSEINSDPTILVFHSSILNNRASTIFSGLPNWASYAIIVGGGVVVIACLSIIAWYIKKR